MKKSIFYISFLLFILFPAFSESDIDFVIRNMTLREKVGQLFIISPESIDIQILQKERQLKKEIGLIEVSPEAKKYYRNYPAGGFIFFGKNIKNPDQLKKLTTDLHHLGNIKPLLFIDEEGGSVARIAKTPGFEVPTFDNMKILAANQNLKAVHDAGNQIGEYLLEYGFDVNFSPVADVDTNPKNPVIGSRAFSSKPDEVSVLAYEMLLGLQEKGIQGCYKHFPGHGDTNTDTHLEYSEINKTWKELFECELVPFIYGIEHNIPMIMTAHISIPNITGNKIPASLSYDVITKILREELNYDGIAITDSLMMKAITNHYSTGEAAILTILAGNDFILLPKDYETAFNAVLDAVNSNIISESRLDESLQRILKFKKYFNKNSTLLLD